MVLTNKHSHLLKEAAFYWAGFCISIKLLLRRTLQRLVHCWPSTWTLKWVTQPAMHIAI